MQRAVLLSMKVITPKLINLNGIIPAWQKENEKIGKEMEKDFRKTTQTWTHKVQFVKEIVSASGRIGVRIYTVDTIWRYLDEGTKAHYIPVVPPSQNTKAGKPGKGYLAWRSGYKSKTSVGTIPSVAGGASGSWVYSRKGHMVSGIQARNWVDLIYRKWERLYVMRMSNRMNEELKKAQPETRIPKMVW